MSVQDELRAYAQEEPEQIADGRYADVEQPQPCCIVGRYLFDHGFTYQELARIDDNALRAYSVMNLVHQARAVARGISGYPEPELALARKLADTFDSLSQLELHFLADAQAKQDNGNTWAESVQYATERQEDHAREIAEYEERYS